MLKYTLQIDGMACGMCEAHIADTIRKVVPNASKVSASHTKKSAIFLTNEQIDENKLKEEISKTGYILNSVHHEEYVKKGLFNLFK